jgi:hypothetical protein
MRFRRGESDSEAMIVDEWPGGFSYWPEFISEIEERELVVVGSSSRAAVW